MKTSFRPLSGRSPKALFAASFTLLLGQAHHAAADVFNWDPLATGTATGGGAGIWDTTSNFWFNGTTDVAWPNTTPSTHSAIFSGTGGIVTVSSPITINSMTVSGAGYSFAQSTGGSNNITFNGTTPSITATSSFTIAVPVATASTVSINGNSGNTTLSLSGNVSGSGGLVVNSGARLTLSSTTGNSLTGTVTVNTGGVLTVSSNSSGNAFGTGSLVLAGGTFGPRYNGSDNANMNNAARPLSVTADSTIDVRRGSGSTTNVTVQMTTLAIGANKLTVTGANNFSFGLTGNTTLSGNATFEVDSTVGSATKYGLTLTGMSETGGARSITKTGGGTLGVNGTSASYTGTTTVTAGGLYMNANQTGGGAVNVASGATFGGTGTISGATTINGIHAPGTLNAIGVQTFSNLLTYAAGSSFQWQMDAGVTDPGAGAANSGSYDRIVANGAVTGTSAFNISLTAGAFTDAFWDTDKTWNNVISGTGSSNLQTLFTSFSGSGVTTDGTVADQGKFSFNGNTLVWTAIIPEPSSAALFSVMAAGALLRRKRR